MNPELQASKLREVDTNANREKARVEYVVNLIESDENRMRQVFLSEEERNLTELEIAELLFERVSRTLDSLRVCLTKTGGVVLHRFAVDNPPNPSATDILGWEIYGPPMLGRDEGAPTPGKVYTHLKYPTELGRQMVDGLLSAQGYVDTRQQADLNRRRWDEAWAPHH